MRKIAFPFLVCILFVYGCPSRQEYIQRYGMMVGYVPGPFFHYGQTKLAETRHFNLGNIPNEIHKITATIPFTNQGAEKLVIENIDCNCPCFAGWDGDKELEHIYLNKGPKGLINVYLNKDKIETGPASIPVIIKTNDPSNKEVKIFFDFFVIRNP